MSNDDMGGILCLDCLRTLIFLTYVLIQIVALLIRPIFEALKIPDNFKKISKIKHRLDLRILKKISM